MDSPSSAPWINYHHLLYFKTIAEEGGVSKAALKLRLGQPTLSAQLKQFEDQLGVTLFERKSKKLILTEQGKVALDYAKNIFKLGNEMYQVLNDRISSSKTHVQIGALDSISKQVALQITKAAYEHSSCSISVIEGKADEIIRELLAHRIDLVISNYLFTTGESKSLVHRQISKKSVSFYGSTKFKHLKKDFPKSLNKQPLILPTYDSRLRYDMDHWCKINSIQFNIIAESQDISLKVLLAKEGLGLIAAAEHSVSGQLAENQLIEIGKLANVNEEIYLITTERKIENPVASFLFKNFEL